MQETFTPEEVRANIAATLWGNFSREVQTNCDGLVVMHLARVSLAQFQASEYFEAVKLFCQQLEENGWNFEIKETHNSRLARFLSFGALCEYDLELCIKRKPTSDGLRKPVPPPGTII
jgi:hypothetical protein